MSEEIWIPTLEEYPAPVSVEQWKSFLQDNAIVSENALLFFKRLYKAGEASCSELSERFGETVTFYNNNNWQTGKKIYELTNCPLSSREDETERFWSICCLGKNQSKDKLGSWVFKLRPELQQAMEELGMTEELNKQGETMTNNFLLNIDKMNEILKKYKEDFPKYFPDEKYKWQAVKHFQSTWDIEATDFTAMFENATSKAYNLLDSAMYFPRAMILDFCKENSERVRAMFKNLFDENIDLSKRFESFRREADDFLQVFNGTKKNHFQNTNSISVYLWLRFPEKYYIYKYSEYIKVADILSANYKPKKGNVQSVINGFIFYDKIRNFLKTDLALIDLLNSNLDETCWDDTELYTLTFDFGFYISRYLKSTWIVAANPKYYDVHGAFNKFSVIDWKQSNQNISEGDTVYIYISDEIKRIEYKTKVLKTNMEKSEIDDSEFQIDNSNYADSKKMQLQLLDSVETEELSFSNLRKNGLKGTLQSPEKITIKLIDYIEQFFGGETMTTTNKVYEYVQLLKSNHNIILHGAPGTGKTHLAKEIALKLIFPTEKELTFENMNEEQEKRFNEQYSFVQFHPSYDYTDFVEGLRPDPETSINGQIGFKRMDGVFKEFCKKAVKNFFELSNDEKLRYISSYLNTEPTIYANEKLQNVMIKIIEDNKYQFINDEVSNPDNKTFSAEDCIYKKNVVPQAIYKNVEEQYNNRPPFIFIIDEINRGEISKIFGELFFSIDPGYRGEKGAVKTQYASMINNANEFDAVLQKEKSDYGWFFVPENVYIIGTMNDIDRSVESMDFAMRRRFAFHKVSALSTQNMLDNPKAWEDMCEGAKQPESEVLQEIKNRMNNLNYAIWHKQSEAEKNNETNGIEGFSDDFHIGAAYFLKYALYANEENPFKQLWKNHLEILLKEYLRGTGNEEKIKILEEAYNNDVEDKTKVELLKDEEE